MFFGEMQKGITSKYEHFLSIRIDCDHANIDLAFSDSCCCRFPITQVGYNLLDLDCLVHN